MVSLLTMQAVLLFSVFSICLCQKGVCICVCVYWIVSQASARLMF